jgi:hypothetical protein
MGLAAFSSAAAAQTAPSADSAPNAAAVPAVVVPPAEAPPPAPGYVRVPANTPVSFDILDPISSKTAKIDEMFTIRTTAPVIIDGKAVIPAGALGQGQIVHAARARAMGKAGELILAARYIDCGDVHVTLRGFHLDRAGMDRAGTALVASMVFTPAGFFVVGGESTVMAGSHANARLMTAVDLRMEPTPICTAAPVAAPAAAPPSATTPAPGGAVPVPPSANAPTK